MEDRQNLQVSSSTPVISGPHVVSLSRGPVVIKESSGAAFLPTGHPWHSLSVQKSSVGRADNASSPRPYPVSGKLEGEQSMCPDAAERRAGVESPAILTPALARPV